MLQINRISYDKSTQKAVKNDDLFKFETNLNLDRFLEVNKEMVLAEENNKSYIEKSEELLAQKGSFKDIQISVKNWKRASYELTNVVIHSGEAGSGHYYVYGKNQGNWFKFNDRQVTQETEEIMMKDANGETYCKQNVYALFYTLLKDESMEPVTVIKKVIV